MSLNGAAAMYGGSAAATVSGGVNLATSAIETRHFGAMHDLLVMLDFSALDALSAFVAITGLVIAVLGFLDTRSKNRAAKARDRAIEDYLKNSAHHNSEMTPEVIAKLNSSLKKAEQE